MRRKLGLAVVCIMALLLTGYSCVEARQYQIHVLDVPQGRAYSAAYGINDQRTVAGVSAINYDARNNAGIVYWDTTGTPHSTGFPLGSSFGGLNNLGAIVGGHYVYSNGSLTTLPKLNDTYGSNNLTDINDVGTVVGSSLYDYVTGDSHAVYWDSIGIHDLGTLDGHTSSVAHGINDQGQVVGSSWSEVGSLPQRAVVWEDGNETKLDPLSGYDYSSAFKINNFGMVVGSSSRWDTYYSSGVEFSYLREEAALWGNGAVIDIAVEGMNTFASDINDLGQVVGYAYSYPYASVFNAFMWQGGEITWLDGIDGAATMAYGINSSGWIAGQAYGSDNNWHAVVWEPVPEPSSILVLVCGIGSLVGTLLRRRE